MASLSNLKRYSYFFTLVISMIGIKIQTAAIPWIVYGMTDSVYWLGLIAACEKTFQIATIPLAGQLGDRMSRRSGFLMSQFGQFLVPITLAVLLLMNRLTVHLLVAMVIVEALINGIEIGFRNAVISDLSHSPDRKKAEALLAENAISNASLITVAKLLSAPLVALALVFKIVWLAFIFNAVSFIPIIWITWSMRREVPGRTRRFGWWRGFKNGIRYMKVNPVLLHTIIMNFLMTALCNPMLTLVPAYVKKTLNASPAAYGYASTLLSVGAVVSIVMSYWKKDSDRVINKPSVYLLPTGLLIVLVGLNTSVYAYYVLSLLYGFFSTKLFIALAVLNLKNPNDYFRGRAVSMFLLSSRLAGALAGYLGGVFGQYFGVGATITGAGVLLLLTGVAYFPNLIFNKGLNKEGSELSPAL